MGNLIKASFPNGIEKSFEYTSVVSMFDFFNAEQLNNPDSDRNKATKFSVSKDVAKTHLKDIKLALGSKKLTLELVEDMGWTSGGFGGEALDTEEARIKKGVADSDADQYFASLEVIRAEMSKLNDICKNARPCSFAIPLDKKHKKSKK